MFEVTPIAEEQLVNYLKEYEMDSPIRISIMQQGNCSTMALGMVFDTATENDKTFKTDGLEFIVEEELLTNCGSIKVDFIEVGYSKRFAITSSIPVVESDHTCTGACGNTNHEKG